MSSHSFGAHSVLETCLTTSISQAGSMVCTSHAQQAAGISVLWSVGLWYATVRLISPQREQMDSYRDLNKGNCSSERVLLSNKYKISWMTSKPGQVFYRLVGTHFSTLPGDALELEGEKQSYVTLGGHRRRHIPETDQFGNSSRGPECVSCPQQSTDSPFLFRLQGTPVSPLHC